ncbi:hypothetical protein LAZ67_1008343 [Cordylochernes scorpioides]|uniref:Uncharacterized protein n=1 Tax=Cordylochernes scorpioides TaxID=51811 RepID=A0ABY6K019_9ARAC|nr:hypothetical protein LAZ67_1008343 [Cordylochernes scorpioides]
MFPMLETLMGNISTFLNAKNPKMDAQKKILNLIQTDMNEFIKVLPENVENMAFNTKLDDLLKNQENIIENIQKNFEEKIDDLKKSTQDLISENNALIDEKLKILMEKSEKSYSAVLASNLPTAPTSIAQPKSSPNLIGKIVIESKLPENTNIVQFLKENISLSNLKIIRANAIPNKKGCTIEVPTMENKKSAQCGNQTRVLVVENQTVYPAFHRPPNTIVKFINENEHLRSKLTPKVPKGLRIKLCSFMYMLFIPFAGTDALGLGREEVLDLLSSRTKAQKHGPLLSPPQGDALAGLIKQILDLRPGAGSNIYKVLGQVKAELRTTPAAVPTPPLPAPRPAEPTPPAPQDMESSPAMATPPPPQSIHVEDTPDLTRWRSSLACPIVLLPILGKTLESMLSLDSRTTLSPTVSSTPINLDSGMGEVLWTSSSFSKLKFRSLYVPTNAASLSVSTSSRPLITCGTPLSLPSSLLLKRDSQAIKKVLKNHQRASSILSKSHC